MNALTYKANPMEGLMRPRPVAPAVTDHTMLTVRRCIFEDNQ